jgi:lipopolysaccharide/colanic/teichoic acid biosynthesis glycosyltransferase
MSNGRSHSSVKRLFDLTVAALALFLLSPLLGLLALLVRLKLGSPILFRQQRPGLHGKPFTLSKFHSAMWAIDRQTGRAGQPAARRRPAESPLVSFCAPPTWTNGRNAPYVRFPAAVL